MSYKGKYATEINNAAKTYHVDPYLIAAVIQAESSFNPKIKSGAGAKGLMQVKDGTFKEYGKGDIYNPKDNINAGTNYLAKQIKTFNSVDIGLAAYNVGPGTVKKAGNKIPKAAIPYVLKVKQYWKEQAKKGGDSISSGSGNQPTGGSSSGGSGSGSGVQTTIPTNVTDIAKSPILWVSLLIIFLIK